MSRLVYSGDTTGLFGTVLPTPKIDSIKIKSLSDDEWEGVDMNSGRIRTHMADQRHGEMYNTPGFYYGEDGTVLPYDERTDVFYGAASFTDPEASSGNGFDLRQNWVKLEVELSVLFNSDEMFEPEEMIKYLFDNDPDTDIEPMWVNLFFLRDDTAKIDNFKSNKEYIANIREIVLNYTTSPGSRLGTAEVSPYWSYTDEASRDGDAVRSQYYSASPAYYKVSLNQRKMSDLYTNVQVTPYLDNDGNNIFKVSNIRMVLFTRAPHLMKDATIFATLSTHAIQDLKTFEFHWQP